ncbi:MAG: hypothetical protein WAX01_05265, partial [Streptococcus suis]
PWPLSLTASSLLSNEITGLLKDSETNIFEQSEVANFIIELSELPYCSDFSENFHFSIDK